MSDTFDFAALAAGTDHRDAELLDLIEQFAHLNDTSCSLVRRAERFKADGRTYRRLWREVLSTHDERERLEGLICTTRARTQLGAIAKGQLWLDIYAENAGTMMNLPRAAIVEMIAMLGRAGA